jgi:hypothetical protein
MMRLAWVQSRVQTGIAAAGLLLVGALLLVTGPHLVDLYHSQVVGCSLHGDCGTAEAAYLRTDRSLFNILGFLVLFTPAAVGAFYGAPLVARELETGTHRLAWTQSVTRSHWLGGKLTVVGLAGMTVTGLLSLLVGWWAHPLDTVQADQFSSFDMRGVVPLAYAAFAVALGVTCGIVLRRTLAAMAATLVGFAAARLAVNHVVRPFLLTSQHLSASLHAGNSLGFTVTPSATANAA